MPATLQPLMDNELLKKALESLLFITDHPLSAERLCKLVGLKDAARVAAMVEELKKELNDKDSAVQILEVADGYQMATRPAFAPFVKKLFTERMTMRLSTAAHETLSIIAYKQPLTRAEIEQIRGVEVIAALETLVEKGLIKVVGRKESVGRPLMYGTTTDFLRHFGLRSLEDLPSLEQFSVAGSSAETPVSAELLPLPAGDETSAQSADDTASPVENNANNANNANEAETNGYTGSAEPGAISEESKAPPQIWPTSDDDK